MLFGFQVSTVRRVAVIAALILYSESIGAFGFAMTTPLFLFAILYAFGRKKLVENVLVSVIGGVAFWVLFDLFLKMPLTGDVWDPVTPALAALFGAIGG